MQPQELFPFQKFIPKNTTPFLIAEDGKENCGYSTESRFIIIYYHTLNEYISIEPIKKKSDIITIPNTNQRFWIVDLQHFLKSMLEGNYSLSYFFHPNNENKYQFYSMNNEYCSKWLLFINSTNICNIFNSTMKLLETFSKNFGFEKKTLPYLLHAFRSLLYAERLLRNEQFPSPNIFDLKKNHKHENFINELLQIDVTHDILQSFQYRKCLDIIEQWKYELHTLKENFHQKYTFNDLVQQGNDVFLYILQTANTRGEQ